MTVEVNDTIERYPISGTGPYAFSWRIFDESELIVTALDTGDVDPVTLTLNSHYTVSGENDEDGGSITLINSAETTYAGFTLDIRSSTALEQPTSIKNQGSFKPKIHELALDRLSRQIQDIYRQIKQSWRYPDNVNLDAKMTSRSAWLERYPFVNSSGEIEPAVAVDTTPLTQSIIGGLLYPRTAAETSASVTPTDFSFRPGDVRRYGAVGDNSTNDLTALRDAFSQFEQDGGAPVIFERGKIYYCGTASSSPTLFSVDDVVGGAIYANGAQVRINTTDTSAPIGLQLNDCKFIDVFGLRFTDDGASQASQSGIVGFDVRASAATDEDIGHITLHDCEVDSGVMFLRVAGDATGQASTNQTNRIRNVNVIRGRVRETFYAVNLQNHGDDCHIDLHCENLHRAMFYYGVTGLRANIYIRNPRGGYAQILTKAYDRSTENARIKAYVETSASSYEFVTFEFQNDTQDESIRDIEVDLNCRNGVSNLTPVLFRAYDSSQVARATTTNRWDNIRIKGDWSGFNTPFIFTTRQSIEGRIIIDPSLGNQLPNFLDLSGFVLVMGVDSEIRSVTGDLTGNSITIPLDGYDGQAFSIRVTVSAQDNTSSTSSAGTTDEEVIIKGSNSSGGSVTVHQTTTLYRDTFNTASTISYTASGENIVVAFTAYSNASAHARVKVQHLRGYV